MEELQKISVKDFFLQVKNMVISPKNALKDMGNEGNYSSVAVPQIFLSMVLVPIAIFIALLFNVIGGSGIGIGDVFGPWLIFSGSIMFYYLLITWGVSKLLWMLKDSTGFEGTQEKFNQIIVLTFSAFFIGNSIYWLLTFIDALVKISSFLAPVLGSIAAGYVLFQGFSSDFEVAEDKKPIFVGIMVAIPAISLILFHLLTGGAKTLYLLIAASKFGGMM